MSFSGLVKDELLKKDFTAGKKAYNIRKYEYQQNQAREFLRRAFLECGSMTDPNKEYHLEFVCETHTQAEEITERLQKFELNPRITMRGKYELVYVKDSAQIAEILNIIGAHNQLMEFENVRILKGITENVNRRVNCEMANIEKTISASMKQQEDILFIKEVLGFGSLDEGLREVAEARLEHPDATLSELTASLSTPIGRSGVNHRLRKLGRIAEKLREDSASEPSDMNEE